MVPIERRTQCMLLSASFNPEPVSLTDDPQAHVAEA